MKTKFSSLILISVCAFAVSVMLGYILYGSLSGSLLGNRRRPAAEPAAHYTFAAPSAVIPTEAVSANADTLEYYLIKENRGKIGIFASSGGDLYFLYNIDRLVVTLPDADKALINHGVVLYTKEELASFIEDFSS